MEIVHPQIPPSPSRRRRLLAAVLSLAAIACAGAQNQFLVYEDFYTTPLDALPPNFTLTGTASPTVIGVKDAFGSYLQGKKALRFEDRNIPTIPYLTVSSTTPAAEPFSQGWFRVKFVPVDNGSTYQTPRFFFRLRGMLNQTAVWFQIHGERLTYYEAGSTPVDLLQVPVNNVDNDLLVWFDMNGRTVRGELNGVTLTRKPPYSGQPLGIDQNIPAQAVDLELRAGDSATDKEAMLIKLVELGQGAGPAVSHTRTSGTIRVQVPARLLAANRTFDEAPTQVELNFPQLLSQAGFQGRVELSSLKVVPVGAAGPEMPCRWYDRDAPQDFPVAVQALNATPNGDLVKVPGHNYGSVYPVSGDSGVGRLAWIHRQDGNAMSQYDILFTTRPQSAPAGDPGPLKWTGDGSARFEYNPDSTCATSHVRVAVTDWDGDGKKDVIFGEQYGLVFFLKNVCTGTAPLVPAFTRQEYVRGDDGNPVSIGLGAAPLIVDWDGDTREDLLLGTHYNRIAYFRNVGSNTARKFSYQGILKIGSSPLQLPFSPNGGGFGTAYTKDYYPVLESVDWDGDGDKDLLAGGYVTGRIYFFRNTGTAADKTPILAAAEEVPLHDKNGALLNDVGDWCAAPTVADVNGDGKQDLITGLWNRVGPTGFILRMFLNDGTNAAPHLVEQDINRSGAFPSGSLSSPRLAEMTGDNLLDLVMGMGKNLYIFRNIGTPTGPKWEGTQTPVKTPWGNSSLAATQLLPINGDSKPDIYSGGSTFNNTGAGNPFQFAAGVGIFADGSISHPSLAVTFPDGTVHSGSSTANIQHKLLDLDRDNKLDFLYADWHGQVWFHRNTGTGGPPYTFDEDGVCLAVKDGPVISVDLTHAAKYVKTEGGARPVFTIADFNGDGRNDLVLGDTFGNVRYFRGAGTAGTPVTNPHLFSAGVFIKDEIVPGTHDIEENMRGIDGIDWDLDGDLDVVTGSTLTGSVTVYKNKGVPSPCGDDFLAGIQPTLPAITQPVPIGTDLNGDGGAEDLFLPGTQGSFWIERSFIDGGYAPATVLGLSVPP